MRIFLRIGLITVITSLTFRSFLWGQEAGSKPNIVLILADDLGFGDVGINGQQKFKTPNIDRLASDGMRFNNFYSGTSVCAPSRASLMSGRHTGHTYIRGNKEALPEGQEPIPDSIYTIAEMLSSVGYHTAALGKWGLGPVGTTGDPLKQGFNKFYGYNCQREAHRYYPIHLWDNNQKIILKENRGLRKPVTYAEDMIHEEALKFLSKQTAQKPFFLYLPYTLPHAELLAPADSLAKKFAGKFVETPFSGNDYGADAKPGGYASQLKPRATFAAMVCRLDVYVGQILDKLVETGLDQNTLIIFTSDNGPHHEAGADPAFFNSSGGLRGEKRDLYEGGIRVPFIAHWPGKIKAGAQSDFIGAFWDLLPTFAELTGNKPRSQTDGISIVPTLLGNGGQQEHEYLYWEFHEDGGRQAVRQGNWKAVRLNVDQNAKSDIALFDLAEDPAETTDVAYKNPYLLDKMASIMEMAHNPSSLFPFQHEKK